MIKYGRMPKQQGLYDPQYEHDNCGVGFVVNINGEKGAILSSRGLAFSKGYPTVGLLALTPKLATAQASLFRSRMTSM